MPNTEECRDRVFNFEGVFCWYLGDSLILPNIYELLGIVLYCGELIVTYNKCGTGIEIGQSLRMDNPFHVLALLGVSNDSSSLQYEYFY